MGKFVTELSPQVAHLKRGIHGGFALNSSLISVASLLLNDIFLSVSTLLRRQFFFSFRHLFVPSNAIKINLKAHGRILVPSLGV